MARRVAVAFQRFDAAEVNVCRYLNRSSRSSLVRQLFRAVSWLGDGWVWYALILALPLVLGLDGLQASAHVAATGALGVLLYKLIKHRAVRERPYITHSVIECVSAPLDRYSFPSGHTLHAVSFTGVAMAGYPVLAWVLVPFTLSVALSRVVLGVHYPSDVVAAAGIGGGLAAATLGLSALA